MLPTTKKIDGFKPEEFQEFASLVNDNTPFTQPKVTSFHSAFKFLNRDQGSINNR